MTAAAGPVPSRPASAGRMPSLALPGRLLRLELRRSGIRWMLPLLAALFWFGTYRKSMALPPLWSQRITVMQQNALIDFAPFVAGAAAWMGSRDGRRSTTDLVAVTALPRWAARVATWAATTCWAIVTYLGCVAVLYGVTARQVTWGGPLWWPVAVGAAGVVAVSALGFAAGAHFPGRFTAPLAAVGALLALLVSVLAAQRSSPYAQILPVNTDILGPDTGAFYPYQPDVSIAQVMFLAGLAAAALGALGLPAGSGGRWLRRASAAVTAAGLLAAGTGVGLAGTARLEAHGWVIPALHDAASNQPVPYTPVCGHAAVPVCLHPAFRAYLPALTAALGPVLSQLAGLRGAPVRVTQVATTYQQTPGGPVPVAGNDPIISGSPPVLDLPFPDASGAGVTTADAIDQVPLGVATTIVDTVIGGGTPAQQAVAAALLAADGVPLASDCSRGQACQGVPGPAPGSPAYVAAGRFAALPAATRHAWLAAHLAALRAGRVTLTEIP